jgi:hypothetical protein
MAGRGEVKVHRSTELGGDERAHHGDAEGLTDLTRRRSDPGGHAGLGARHPRDRRIGDRSTYAVNNHENGVESLTRVSMMQPTRSPTPEMMRGMRAPRTARIRPEITGNSRAIDAMGKVSIPAWSGESPRTSWR